MALKEEIFKQNTTLFDVLDDNDITQIGTLDLRLTGLKNEVDANKLQLDGLARIVDQNQARNESQFVSINTQLIGINDNITNLNNAVEETNQDIINLQQQYERLEDGVINEIGNITVKVGELNSSVDQLNVVVRDNVVRLNLLQDNLNSLQLNVQQLSQAQNTLRTELQTLESVAKTGIRIVPGDRLTAWFFNNNQFTNIAIDFRGQDFLRMGRIYDAQLTGSQLGIFEVIFAPNSTYSINGTAIVPVTSGQRLWFSYKSSSASNFTAAEVYLYTS